MNIRLWPVPVNHNMCFAVSYALDDDGKTRHIQDGPPYYSEKLAQHHADALIAQGYTARVIAKPCSQ